MEFLADLHIHSRYSRATAKNLDLEHLYIAARIKGITVVGTGDFTHPGWFSEIVDKLEPAEPGLFRLKPAIARVCDTEVPSSCRKPVRFILATEISNIYKKEGRTRKNHNLVFLPDIAHAEIFNAKLDAIGNITSDGRPILGLDAKHLLEILLEVTEEGFLVPAHIWTPWFSLLGSKSGFDSLEACFEDLSPHIFAVETGLSSDPIMNRRVSGLDGLTLISNSDAHSPFYLGREANLFNTELSYHDMKSALKSGDSDRFPGTFEFYPEEGKYHYDGHRKCGVRLHPEESLRHNGICPVCGRPLTLGVLYRVMELADRDTADTGSVPFFHSIIPLPEILAEIYSVGPKTKKTAAGYDRALRKLGPEFDILHTIPTADIQAAGIPLLDEAIERMRDNRLHVSPGYDGEFGKVTIFEPEERKRLMGRPSLFSGPGRRLPPSRERR
ncbi:MAG: endonuclease Q family protein [Desulfobacterales bacterium]